MRNRTGWTLFALLAWPGALACASVEPAAPDDGIVSPPPVEPPPPAVEPPVVTSFSASRSGISAGDSVQLTAVFSGGTGTVEPGVGAVASGVPVTVAPATTTQFSLTVRGDNAASATSVVTVVVTAPGGTTVFGAVDGTFTLAGSPYRVTGDIWVPLGRSLRIEPGVQVRFQGHFKMNVYGSLDARGSADSRILFTAENPAEGWFGLRWENPATHDTTAENWIEFVTFEYGDKSHPQNYGWYENGRGGALFVYNQSGMHINDNVFRSNKAQDKCGAVVFISVGPGIDMSRNVFENNWSQNAGGAICFLHGAAGTSHYVRDSVFRGNSAASGTGGVYVYDTRLSLLGVLFEGNIPSDYDGSTITVVP
jgi:hypothetical protein